MKKPLRPMDVPSAPGAEKWREIYPDYLSFDSGECEELAKWESEQFWYRNHLHWPRPIYPIDEFFVGGDTNYIGQYNSRVFVIPSAMGMPYRVLNGYVYNTMIEIHDSQIIEKRLKIFEKVLNHCLTNWDRLVDDWVKKVKECITELEQLSFPPLPEVEDGIAVIEGDGTPSGYTIMKTNRDLWSLGEKVWCLHYELLGLVYGMYVELGEFCKQHGFGDAIETIVKGMTPLVLECTEKLKELAKYSIELGLQELFRKYRGEELLKQLEKNINGKKWLEMFDAVKYPYFLACEAQSLYFDERAWIDDLDTLFYNINGYITKLERGESIEREIDELIKERDSKTQECYNMLKTDADREAFNNLLNTVRKIYPFSEDHNFYVEFWSFGLVRNTVRKLGAWLVHHGVLDSADDIMFFKRYEIEEVLFDVCQAWGSGIGMMFKSPSKWRKKVAETRKMYDAFIKWTPPDILGSFPEKITEPFTIMLWGITDEKLAEWKNDIEQSTEINKAQEIHEIQGIAGSPGVVEGPAKVITRFSESTQVKEGDILVTFTIAPAWGPILNRVKAVVLDAGGKMCHGAIVAREERVPAVVGSRVAMNIIKTGDIIRVDGNKGIVTILKRME